MRRHDPEVTDPKRIRQFASFFKNYMGLSTIVVAALPVPVGILRMIPVYEPDIGSTTFITSLFCFLLLAFIFFIRHGLARLFFQEFQKTFSSDYSVDGMNRHKFLFSAMILFLIVTSIGCFFYYQFIYIHLDFVVREGRTDPQDIALLRVKLMGLYTACFALAEGAFVLMATKEYLQDVLSLSDNQLIHGPKPTMADAPSRAD
jgi:hypothetical protein